jgi:hypothetical protein
MSTNILIALFCWIAALTFANAFLWLRMAKYRRICRAIISGVDMAMGDAGTPERLRTAIWSFMAMVSDAHGCSHAIDKMISKMRQERLRKAAKAIKMGKTPSIQLDAIGRPVSGFNLKLDL